MRLLEVLWKKMFFFEISVLIVLIVFVMVVWLLKLILIELLDRLLLEEIWIGLLFKCVL